MPEEFKPLFPRSPEDEERRKKLLWETQGKLEKEENSLSGNEEIFCPFCGFKNFGEGYFCRMCGSPIDSEKSKTKLSEEINFPVPVYGPAPMDFADKTDDEIHVTAYGPPPMSFDNPREPLSFVYGPPSIPLEDNENNFNPPLPVYGPPPMPIRKIVSDSNRFSILIALLLFGLILFGAVIAIIIYFLFLR